jgi:hypothetical protein
MIEQYIEQNLFKNPNALVSISTLMGDYRAWAMRNMHPQLTRNQFIAGLEALGYVIGIHHNTRAVVGLTFSNEPRFTVVDGKILKNPSYPAMSTR